MKLSAREYLVYGGIGLSLMALVIAYGPEFEKLGHTLDAGKLIAWSALGGLLSGLALGFVLRAVLEKRRGYPFEPLERFQIVAITLLLCVFFAPLFGSWLNRGLASQEVEWKPFVFYKESGFYANRYGLLKGESLETTAYHLDVFDQDIEHSYRFTLSKPVAEGLRQGADIQLPLRRGFLGFYIFDESLLSADNQ